MDTLRLASEGDRGIIVQEVLKAVPKDAQDGLRKRQAPRHRQMGSADRMRQLTRCEPVSARSLFDEKRGRHLGEEGRGILACRNRGCRPAPRRLDASLIERSPRDAGFGSGSLRTISCDWHPRMLPLS